MKTPTPQQRLEYLRAEIRAERISYGEISELQSLVPYIDKDDVELLQWAGVPEFTTTYRIEGPGFSAYVKGTSPGDAKRRLFTLIDEQDLTQYLFDSEGDEVQLLTEIYLPDSPTWTVEESE